MRKLFVVPARQGSKRLPRKNLVELAGKPLYQHTIDLILSVAHRSLDKCIVSTDIKEIPDFSESDTFFLKYARPAEISGDDTPSNETLTHAVDAALKLGVEFDWVFLLQVTSPFRTRAGFETFAKSVLSQSDKEEFSHASVSRLPLALYELGVMETDGSFAPLSRPPSIDGKTWSGQNAGFIDGCYYAASRNFIERYGGMGSPDQIKFHPGEKEFQVDIDTEFDLNLARRMADFDG